jgi:hypothetical protein
MTACAVNGLTQLHGSCMWQVALMGERPVFPEDAPEDYVLLATSCWRPDGQLRPDFGQASLLWLCYGQGKTWSYYANAAVDCSKCGSRTVYVAAP